MKTDATRAFIFLALALSLSVSGLARADEAPGSTDGIPKPVQNGRPWRSTEPTPTESAASPAPQPGLRLLRSDERSIVLELYTPGYQVERQATPDLTCDRLSVADYATTGQSGWPALPVHGALLGIPPQARVTLAVLEVDAQVLPGRYALCPVPTPDMQMTPTGQVQRRGVQLLRDTAAYAADAFWPIAAAELEATGFVRSQRVAQVRLNPFQYNPASGELRHLRRIRVQLSFDGDLRPSVASGQVSDAAAGEASGEGSFEDILRHSVLNYAAARRWRTPPAPAISQAAGAATNAPQGLPTIELYKVSVEADGIYALTHADLLAAGIDASDIDDIDPHTFQLSNRGQEVARHVTGTDDGSFDPGDVILFYGQKAGTKYTDVNVYWLMWGKGDGKRMATIDGALDGVSPVPPSFQTTRRVEQDHDYHPYYPNGPDGDHWYWNTIYALGALSRNYTFQLQHIATTPFSATVRGLFQGYYGDHHTRIYLNNHLIDDAIWDAQAEYTFEAAVPHAWLVEGSNTIRVHVPFDQGEIVEVLFVNRFEVDYDKTYTADGNRALFDGDGAGTWRYRVGGFSSATVETFDVTAPLSPLRVLSATLEPAGGAYTLTFQHTITEEHRYISLPPAQRLSPLSIEHYTPAGLRSSANGADYVVITHADFYTDVQPLASYRAAQGLRTAVVDVADVYDEFGYGIFDPEAIRDFLAYAYANWTPPAPAYVLLVGDGNYDFKNNEGTGEPNYVPPYLADVDPWTGETAADNRYVCVSGTDTLPDMHLGRLPAKSDVEVSGMVAKIIAYEQNPPGGDWNRQALFVADDFDPQAGDFAALSDGLIAGYLPAPYVPERVYLGVTHPYENPSVAARNAIIAAINAGKLLVNYIGHADKQVWAGERMFRYGDIAGLTNGGRLPLMVPMTCREGYYIIPSPSGQDRSAIGEGIVRAAGKGAIASWSPTGDGTSDGHDYLNKGLFKALFFDGVTRLGPATTQGKLYLYSKAGGQHQYLLDTYLLFGDPALALNVLKTDVAIAKAVQPAGVVWPGDTVTYTLTYSNAGPATAHHVAITDALPATLLTPTVTSTGAAITLRSGSRLAWDVADLPAGAGGVITITAVVSGTVPDTLVNSASIATSAVETNTVNNTASAVTGLILSIARSGSDAVLSWNAVSGAASYHVYRDTAPYFVPSTGNRIASPTSPGHADPGTIGDPAQNTYYLITAVDGGGKESAPSNRVGEFDFGLVAGAGATEGQYNVIAFPLDATADLPDADALATHVGLSVKEVLHWDAHSAAYEFWLPDFPFWGTNFALEVGQVYWLRLGSTAPAVVSFVGGVPWQGAVRFDLVGSGPACRANDISLPLDQSAITTASQLAADMAGVSGGVEQVLRWDAATQTLEFWLPEAGVGTDFVTRIGYPYHACLKAGPAASWP